ncbi:MAG TPA: ATP-binding protein, partial [Polyangiaceae bacterium LLY-WYZ-15_(1-7)]|nr:ATP-binding protein [Polyangiaceae bacterium LLY-WYZ-15_(1-7)]
GGAAELPRPTPSVASHDAAGPDLADVRGQASVRRAFEIAAAGGHHLLMIGPPGAGKTMLARRLPTLLPTPDPEEALEIATVASAAGLRPPGSLEAAPRPFRAPHHTASAAAMVGGGEPVRPGEVTLAHRGVLFLDELPEFRRDVIETLRTTMETGEVAICRARQRVRMPAGPLVVAAMNPCPCGYAGDPERLCSCSPERVDRYIGRVSGPLLDRFDLHVMVPRVPTRDLRSAPRSEASAAVRARVEKARARREGRNATRPLETLFAETEDAALALLDRTVDALGLSARGYVKALRVARSIADLEGSARITSPHVAEAIQYRRLDRRPLRERPLRQVG